MLFSHDTELALAEAAALVNTLSDDGDSLTTLPELAAWLAAHRVSGTQLQTADELDSVRALRTQLRSMWTARDRDEAAGIVNALLEASHAQPYLSRHDEWDWHLHVTRHDAPLASRLGAEAAMGFLDLVRTDDLGRLRVCAADDCSDVLVDLSKNKSKRYCDTGNCGNRVNVAAYRARKRTSA
jgi:predicted RNA-binding Zn ribbon-like protein